MRRTNRHDSTETAKEIRSEFIAPSLSAHCKRVLGQSSKESGANVGRCRQVKTRSYNWFFKTQSCKAIPRETIMWLLQYVTMRENISRSKSYRWREVYKKKRPQQGRICVPWLLSSKMSYIIEKHVYMCIRPGLRLIVGILVRYLFYKYLSKLLIMLVSVIALHGLVACLGLVTLSAD